MNLVATRSVASILSTPSPSRIDNIMSVYGHCCGLVISAGGTDNHLLKSDLAFPEMFKG